MACKKQNALLLEQGVSVSTRSNYFSSYPAKK